MRCAGVRARYQKNTALEYCGAAGDAIATASDLSIQFWDQTMTMPIVLAHLGMAVLPSQRGLHSPISGSGAMPEPACLQATVIRSMPVAQCADRNDQPRERLYSRHHAILNRRETPNRASRPIKRFRWLTDLSRFAPGLTFSSTLGSVAGPRCSVRLSNSPPGTAGIHRLWISMTSSLGMSLRFSNQPGGAHCR